MIRAFLDDTGTGQFVGFGGFVGRIEAWAALEGQWLTMNERHSIPWFHAKTYPNLIADYVSLVLDHEILLVGRTIDLPAYRSYAPKKFRNDFGTNKFASAAADCAHLIFNWINLFPGETCDLVIDCQPDYASSIVECVRSDIARRERDPLSSLTLLNSENRNMYAMAQAGDLGANLVAKHTAAFHYKECLDKDFSRAFYERKRFIGIVHADSGSIEKMADVFTDPIWSQF